MAASARVGCRGPAALQRTACSRVFSEASHSLELSPRPALASLAPFAHAAPPLSAAFPPRASTRRSQAQQIQPLSETQGLSGSQLPLDAQGRRASPAGGPRGLQRGSSEPRSAARPPRPSRAFDSPSRRSRTVSAAPSAPRAHRAPPPHEPVWLRPAGSLLGMSAPCFRVSRCSSPWRTLLPPFFSSASRAFSSTPGGPGPPSSSSSDASACTAHSRASSSSVSSSSSCLLLASARRLLRLARFVDRHPSLLFLLAPRLRASSAERLPALETLVTSSWPLGGSAALRGLRVEARPRSFPPLPASLAKDAPSLAEEEAASSSPDSHAESPLFQYLCQGLPPSRLTCEDDHRELPRLPLRPASSRLESASWAESAARPAQPRWLTEFILAHLRGQAGTKGGGGGAAAGAEQLRPETLEGSLEFLWSLSRLLSRVQFSPYFFASELHAPLALLLPPVSSLSPRLSSSAPRAPRAPHDDSLASPLASSSPQSLVPASGASAASPLSPGAEAATQGAAPASPTAPDGAGAASPDAPGLSPADCETSPALSRAAEGAPVASALSEADARARLLLEARLVSLLARSPGAGSYGVSSLSAISAASWSPAGVADAGAALRGAGDASPLERLPSRAELEAATRSLLLPPVQWESEPTRRRFAAALQPLRLAAPEAQPARRGRGRSACGGGVHACESRHAGGEEDARSTRGEREGDASCQPRQGEGPLRDAAQAQAPRDDAAREQQSAHSGFLEPAGAVAGAASVSSLRRGHLLLVHPLTADSFWERAVVLITNVTRKGYIEGLILNKRRVWRPSSWDSASPSASSPSGTGSSVSLPPSASPDASRELRRRASSPAAEGDACGPVAPSGEADVPRSAPLSLLPRVCFLSTSYSNFVANAPRQLRLLEALQGQVDQAAARVGGVAPSDAPVCPPTRAHSESPVPSAVSSPSRVAATRVAACRLLIRRAVAALALHAREAAATKARAAETLSRVMEEIATDMLEAVDAPRASASPSSALAASHAADLRREAPYLVHLLQWYRSRELLEQRAEGGAGTGGGQAGGAEAQPALPASSLLPGLPAPHQRRPEPRATPSEPDYGSVTSTLSLSSPLISLTPIQSAPEAGAETHARAEDTALLSGASRRGKDSDTLIVSFLAALPYGSISPAQAAAAAQKTRRDAALARFLPLQTEASAPEYEPMGAAAEAEKPRREGEEAGAALAEARFADEGRGEESGVQHLTGEEGDFGGARQSRLEAETVVEGPGVPTWGAGGTGEAADGAAGSREAARRADKRDGRREEQDSRGETYGSVLERYSFGGPVPGLTVLHTNGKDGLVEVFPEGVFAGTRREGRRRVASPRLRSGGRDLDAQQGPPESGESSRDWRTDASSSAAATAAQLGAGRAAAAGGEGAEKAVESTQSDCFLVGREARAVRCRRFLGKASWRPGQLERELERGMWILVGCADSSVMQDIVFSEAPVICAAENSAVSGETGSDENDLWRCLLSALAARRGDAEGSLYEAMTRVPLCLATEETDREDEDENAEEDSD
ncbi:hypothetical protein BESB_011140 [Besnoitia besnoiti]|uniref:Uncharacterized protein n=1 Tax=Besnoitia besnoiti TaxID=94643 RepID=A0A2A9MR34_BESBE|nr:hypothetical protein BESB_011140 [Besnoitia besnoiti]PFH38772.1 hypothetical protein BESB_011140 [Besnoitia besnoiti]